MCATAVFRRIRLPFRFRDRRVRNVANLLRRLQEDERRLAADPRAAGKAVWYRGLKSDTHKLVPTFHVQRRDVNDEIYMMNLFRQNAHEFLEGQFPSSEWEWMFLMRHHGLPSRLLDWSENPLVGLYFATEPDRQRRSQDGALWCLLPTQLNRWSLAWPDNSLALPMFTEQEAEYSLGENEGLLNYLPSRIRRPRSSAKPLAPAAAISIRTSKRIQAQLGVFTIHHADQRPLEDSGDQSHIWRFIIPAAQKAAIQAELGRIGITDLTLFPELDNVAREAGAAMGGA